MQVLTANFMHNEVFGTAMHAAFSLHVSIKIYVHISGFANRIRDVTDIR